MRDFLGVTSETDKTRRNSLLLASCVILISACGPQISGSWVDADGITTYEFSGDGQVRISALGAQVDAEYSIEGDRIVISGPQGALVLTRKDEQLRGPMGLVLKPLPKNR